MRNNLLIGIAALALTACGANEDAKQAQAEEILAPTTAEFAASLQERFLDAKPGDVIEIPAGTYAFERSLSLKVDGVTIRGAGQDKTILSFKDQLAGAEGLLVTANDFTIENLAIVDSIGDALKVNEGKNIKISGIRTEWTGGPKTENGAYGIYPVQCENVLVENSIAIGASDAGIYVGQSKNIVVRNNRAEYNVAGIEVENSVGADVFGNIATNNTGGILVFNMPNLPQEGHSTRVFDNQVYENNTKNFGHAGTPVASVPAGSGVVINSNDKVEIFDNDIRDNKTANVIISSVYSTGYDGMSKAESFDPFPEGIFIYGNKFSGGGESPDGLELGGLKMIMFGKDGAFPDILWDGFADPEKMVDGEITLEHRICVQNGDIQILNADGPNGFKNPAILDGEKITCELPKLGETKVAL
ncbi:MAG: hypothetical protein HKN36_06335 [Hellea sp.]|nr:hypothetical protein [Hyphomonadaceae bacterium]NNE57709.1 hypothetical protein [Hellea sp.]